MILAILNFMNTSEMGWGILAAVRLGYFRIRVSLRKAFDWLKNRWCDVTD
jgi:hypothetical protein